MTRTSAPTAGRAVAPAKLTGTRKNVDIAYALLIIAFTIAVLIQIYLAGAGAFSRWSGGSAHPFSAHEDLGHYLGMASGAVLILSLIARANRSTMIGSLFLVLTTEVAQEALASAGHHNRWLGGLHAFDAGVILVLAIWLSITAYRRCLARPPR